jgi:hypothetical protein
VNLGGWAERRHTNLEFWGTVTGETWLRGWGQERRVAVEELVGCSTGFWACHSQTAAVAFLWQGGSGASCFYCRYYLLILLLKSGTKQRLKQLSSASQEEFC